MKLNELITEQEIAEWGMNLAKNLFKGARTTPQKIDPVPIPKPINSKAAQARAGAQYGDTIISKLGFSKDSWVGKLRQNMMAKAIQRKGLKAHNDAVINNMKVATEAQARISNLGLTAFTTTLFLYGVYDYLMARWTLDENDPNYENEIKKLNGEFLLSFLIPRVIGAGLKLTSKMVTGIIKLTGHPRAAEMVRRWGGHVAKVGEAAALAFFQTDKGKEWLAESTLYIIARDFIGSGIEWLIDLGKEYLPRVAAGVTGAVQGTSDYMSGEKDATKDPGVDAYAKTDRPGTITKAMDPNYK
jgi:hypothetical protein